MASYIFTPQNKIITWGDFNISQNLRINEADAPPDQSVIKGNFFRTGDGFIGNSQEPNEDFEWAIRFARGIEIEDFLSQLRQAFLDGYDQPLTITNTANTTGEAMYSYSRCKLKDLSFLSAPIDKTGEGEATLTFLVANEPE